MIIDIDDLSESRVSADVCVIGAGAAGIALALELDTAGVNVVVLESGRHGPDPRTQALYDSEVDGLGHGGIHSHRFRTFGGSTTRWAGQALPLTEGDFEQRPWIPHSGWPLSRADLEDGYQRAAKLLGVPSFATQPAWPRHLPARPAFDLGLGELVWSVFSPQPDFARVYGARLAASSATVVLGANVTELVPDQALTAVTGASVVSLAGRRLDVTADIFAICTGGIETPRLLLASDGIAEGGLGNGNDLVGRFFQDHPGFVVGDLREQQRRLDVFRPRRAGGLKYAVRLVSSPQLQRREELLQASSHVVFDLTQSPVIDAGKQMVGALRARTTKGIRKHLGVMARDPVPLARAAGRHYLRGQPALDPNATPVLAVGCEQAPNPDSRVTLGAARDALGVRRARLTWKLTHMDVSTCNDFIERTVDELDRLGLARLSEGPRLLPEDPDELSGLASDAGHHMGTTRMSHDPRQGVVDPRCRVHGLDNLYVASCAVFPTGGVANPTFTLLALCMRIADDIATRVAAR